MNIKEITKDSIRYPLSDWNKILILGIITLFSTISGIEVIAVLLNTTNITLVRFLVIIEFIIGLLALGYSFKIIKSSLNKVAELPKFNSWVNMFIDGVKFFIVEIVYMIPAILIILLFAALHPSTLGIIESNPTLIDSHILNALIGILNSLGAGIWSLVAVLYTLIIYPISLIAIANMVHTDSKLSTAFKFGEILNKISSIGWGKLIMWYIMLGLIYLAVNLIGMVILIIFSFSTFYIVGLVLVSLTLAPYFYIYLARSLALLYKSEENP